MEAVRSAYEKGFEGVEIDIRLTKDKRIILSHDADLFRATRGGPNDGCHWKYRDRDWMDLKTVAFPFANHLMPLFPKDGIREDEISSLLELRQLGQDPLHPYDDERRADGRVARPALFEDVLGWILEQKSEFILEVECKEAGLSTPLLEVFKRVGGTDRCILFSGERAIVHELEEFYRPPHRPSGLRIGANIRRYTDEWRRILPSLMLDVVDVNAFEVERSEVEELAKSGYWVLSNLGDLPSWWETLNSWEFTGFKTNFPEAYTDWLSRRAEVPDSKR